MLKRLKKLKMSKRIKINTSFEEDEEERRQFFAKLSYAERLRYYLKSRHLVNFHKPPLKRFDLKIDFLYSIPNKLILNS